jgi:serralysin
MPTSSQSAIIQALVNPGAKWSGDTITFSFPAADATWPGYADTGKYSPGSEPFYSYSTLSSVQQSAFTSAFADWARLIPVTFSETDDRTNPGDVRIAFTSFTINGGDQINAHAFGAPVNGASPQPVNGDIWLSDYIKNSTLKIGYDFAGGDIPWAVPNHMIAHALGLKDIGYGDFALGTDISTKYSIMAWESSRLNQEVLTFSRYGADLLTSGQWIPIGGPMVFDILAVQSIYGVNTKTAAGDNTYTWKEGGAFISSLFDGGGTDTIDLAGHFRASQINLTPGAYSSIDIFTAAQQKAYWSALLPEYAQKISAEIDNSVAHNLLYTGEKNLGIAFSTVIENVNAGSGDDVILGNAAANQLNGNGGADQISGGAGNDTIAGGDGQDYLRGDDGADSITGGAAFDDINGNAGADTARGGDGDDWVVGGRDDDVLFGDGGADIVYGNMGADTLDGGEGADLMRGGQDNDSILGGAGNDWISGDRGNDIISGGKGADVFHASVGAQTDWIVDFSYAEGDRIQLDVGMTYIVKQVGAHTILDLGGGDQIVLADVASSTFSSDWIL